MGNAKQSNDVLGGTNDSVENYNKPLAQKVSSVSNNTRNQMGNTSGLINNVSRPADSRVSPLNQSQDTEQQIKDQMKERQKTIILRSLRVIPTPHLVEFNHKVTDLGCRLIIKPQIQVLNYQQHHNCVE